MIEIVKIGLIGVGRIGQLHAENIVREIDNAELIAVSDPNFEFASEISRRLNVAKVFADHRQLLDQTEINAVLICSPTDTHAEISQAAAIFGKHIFCEKPIDFDLEKIDQTLKIVAENGVKFQIGFNRRYDRNFIKLKSKINENEIGNIHFVKITSRDPAPPSIDYLKRSGGIFLDMTIHDFDMARYLIGLEVAEIYAKGVVRIDPEIAKIGDFDHAVSTLTFENGVIAVIDNSRQAVYGYDQRIEVFGERGMISVSNERSDTLTIWNAKGERRSTLPHFFLERYKNSYISEIRSFIDCVIEECDPTPNGNDGAIAVEIAIAAKRSADLNLPQTTKLNEKN